MAFKSKYTGPEIESILDSVKNNTGIGGGETSEIDPVFKASPASGITESDISNWNNKQNYISDISSIREGASAGATALQSVPEGYATKEYVDEKIGNINAVLDAINGEVI